MVSAPPDGCARDVLDTVPAVMQFIRSRMRSLRSLDLSVPQIRALSYIGRNIRPSLSNAADHIGLSLPAMSRLVDALVRKGHVTRTVCPNDRRHVRLELTDSGRSALDEGWQGTRVLLAREIGGLTDDQRGVVSAAMTLLRPLFDPNHLNSSSQDH